MHRLYTAAECRTSCIISHRLSVQLTADGFTQPVWTCLTTSTITSTTTFSFYTSHPRPPGHITGRMTSCCRNQSISSLLQLQIFMMQHFSWTWKNRRCSCAETQSQPQPNIMSPVSIQQGSHRLGKNKIPWLFQTTLKYFQAFRGAFYNINWKCWLHETSPIT